MGKLLLFIALAGCGAWWYFVGGRTVTEDQVRRFYAEQTRATLNREPDTLCGMLASDFHSTAVNTSPGRRSEITQDHDQACAAYRDFYASTGKLGEKMGGTMMLEYDQQITKLELAADRRSAIVRTRFKFDIGGTVINMSGTSVDTLVRRNGTIRVTHSDGQLTTRTGG